MQHQQWTCVPQSGTPSRSKASLPALCFLALLMNLSLAWHVHALVSNALRCRFLRCAAVLAGVQSHMAHWLEPVLAVLCCVVPTWRAAVLLGVHLHRCKLTGDFAALCHVPCAVLLCWQVRNHILARWRADVSSFLSEEEAAAKIMPKHRCVCARYQVLVPAYMSTLSVQAQVLVRTHTMLAATLSCLDQQRRPSFRCARAHVAACRSKHRAVSTAAQL
jgi:hypothetical protein